ncbi:hypothetical protein Lsan_0335 [Legionella santicrucis]|uniref:Uncharacterized protein n=1 Tax=Legionella santicrucis TaxID=45074 RepID=A0A0W0ZEZ8_9GAMM|nr:hypothetical protein [Legionella santicrucis]KTD67540.1 hypothetical protein Lsan_0335 [Legionella santicrucis]
MQEKQIKPFSTQATILQQLGIQNSNGLCSPLANLYASYKMGGTNRAFLDEGPSKTYECAKKMEEHQSAVTQQVSEKSGSGFGSLIGMHVAFFDNHKMFKGERTSIDKLSTTEEATKVFRDSEHVLINYPTPEDKQKKAAPYHQVYYGHTAGTNKCSYFNSNIPGGEREGNCEDVLKTFVEDIKKSAAHDDRDCIIGRSI